jgi:hypothetical protein
MTRVMEFVNATPSISDQFVLKRAWASRSSDIWNDDDFDVLYKGAVVGRIYKATGRTFSGSWFWGLAYDYLDRQPTHGYTETREAAMRALVRSWSLNDN